MVLGNNKVCFSNLLLRFLNIILVQFYFLGFRRSSKGLVVYNYLLMFVFQN